MDLYGREYAESRGRLTFIQFNRHMEKDYHVPIGVQKRNRDRFILVMYWQYCFQEAVI
jgi:hypothetical protein